MRPLLLLQLVVVRLSVCGLLLVDFSIVSAADWAAERYLRRQQQSGLGGNNSRYALDRLGDGHISKFVLEEDASPAENQGGDAAQGTCPASKLDLASLHLSRQPSKSVSRMSGYCFYLGHGSRSCHQTCWQHVQGTCNQAGLIKASLGPKLCQEVLNGFGGLGAVPVVEAPGPAGCTYKDLGPDTSDEARQGILHEQSAPTHCDVATTSLTHHRLCACDVPTPGTHKLPEKHVMIEGESLRVMGRGYDEGKAFVVELLHAPSLGSWKHRAREASSALLDIEDGAAVNTAGTLKVAYSLTLVPLSKEVRRKYHEEYRKVESVVKWWELGRDFDWWAIDFTLTANEWQVFVNGKRTPELDLPRDPFIDVTKVRTIDVMEERITYLPQIKPHTLLPVAFDSRNGCEEYPHSFVAGVATMSFRVWFHSLNANPCVWCEGAILEHGNHVRMEDGQLQVAINGADPPVQTFHKVFETGIEYKLAVSYIAKQRVVELYVDGQRVEIKYYRTAPVPKFAKAQLGCGGTEPALALQGWISSFVMYEVTPPYRPVRGRCHELTLIPDVRALREGSEDIECAQSVCHPDEDLDLCTEGLASCKSYSCPQDMALVEGESSEPKLCRGIKCEASECCALRASCEQLECSTGLTLRDRPADHLCEKAMCTKDDEKHCCETKGHCKNYVCPWGFQLRTEADEIFCNDRECKHTDFNICCAREGTCDVMSCPDNWIKVENSADLVCEDLRCIESRDLNFCCQRPASCGNYVCQELTHVNRVLAYNETTYCKGQTCTHEDAAACCVEKATCKNFKCPGTTVQKKDAALLPCQDATCENTPFSHCCTGLPPCTSMTCPRQYAWRDAARDLVCAGPTCSVDIDLETCCEPRAMCNTTTCQSGTTLVHNASVVPCGGSKCNPNDRQRCCAQEGTCLSMACPTGHVHAVRAAKTSCDGEVCDEDRDVELCCDEKAKCSKAICKGHLVHRADAANLTCLLQECGPNDAETCCVQKGKCSSMHCPEGKTHRENADAILCHDEDCQQSNENVKACCQPRAKCDTMECRWDHVLRRNASAILCKGRQCTDFDDHATCCIEADHCLSLTCPEDEVHRPNARRIFCKDEPPCKQSQINMRMCCEPRGRCSDFDCQPDKVLKHGARGLRCAGAECTAEADEDLCCSQKGSCDLFACPQGSVKHDDASLRYCDDMNCKTTRASACCGELAKCSTRACEENYVHREPTEYRYCMGQECKTSGEGAEHDRDRCCVKRATCSSWLCNSTVNMKRPIAKSLYCAGAACSEIDEGTCCMPRVTDDVSD